MRVIPIIASSAFMSFLLGSSIAVADEVKPDDVLLTAGDVTITVGDMRHYVQERIDHGLPAERFAEPGVVPQLMENLMSIRTLANMARSNGISVDERMQWALDVERDRQLYNRYVHDTVEDKLASTNWNALAKEEYLANKSNYQHPAQVSVSHILVAVSKERNEEQALERINEVAKLLEEGKPFESLVQQYSDDNGSLKQDGALGYFAPGRMVRPFSDAAFAMDEVGDLSEPVKTRFGYHIIRLDGQRPAGTLPFDEVKDEIIKKLQKNMESDLRTQLTLEARSPKEFDLNEENLKALELEYVKPKLPMP
ncbi:peptidylprolyl isomerase [Gilvimarinus sp. DA14]|uniref:peptidylprolyl isomerase n=1 Tax=Gilvimarinus sp. DA14 TaxID=2956798 RepID=UPI0020B70BE5|nr:peptidylprolyl isomerase [Gilvimarinus sp. DA14]UTF59827.1 peptidylprolyl isomerase [Gilvimarinus sp. DA14]